MKRGDKHKQNNNIGQTKDQSEKNPVFNGGRTSLLQIGVVFLAVVSFFTTANGMSEYIFIENSVIAYCASAAIQCILLALSINLPGYLRRIWRWRINGFFRFCVCTITILLTFVTLFCSSWFSYVYIADIIHRDSWGVDSELLVQQTYRSELYDARDYAHTYRIYIEESVGEKILFLQTQARELAKENLNVEVVWDDEKEIYVSNNGTIAASYMNTVIEAMRNATSSNASQESQDLAVIAVADAKRNIADRIDNIQENLETLNNRTENYNNIIADITRRINSATEDTDTVTLSNSINQYTQLVNQIAQQQLDLETESMELDRALRRLSYYESLLGLDSSTSENSIRNSLMELQAEFFKRQPDLDKLQEISTSIFESLRNASNSSFKEGDELTYTNLLILMNQLLRELADYSEIKDIETNLEILISELRESDMESESKTENMSSSSSDGEGKIDTASGQESNDNSPSSTNTEGEDNETDIPESNNMPLESADVESENNATNGAEPDNMLSGTASAENEDYENGNSETDNISLVSADANSANDENVPRESDDVTPANMGDEQWKEVWGDKLQKLKAQISALPTYSVSGEQATITNGVLSDEQIAILSNYDRNKSNENLDDMIRRYIASRNAIYEGIIYLQSPYRSLAIFALILALSFDISGFIFGVVIQGENPQTERRTSGKSKQTEWGIVETYNQYMILTGDFDCKDGTYYYKVFKDGLLEQWAVQDKDPYMGDIYIQKREDTTKGEMVDKKEQALLLLEQPNGPADGIYTECQLFFDEGSLILVRQEQKHFIANINEYTPIHSFNKKRGENRTIPAGDIATNGIAAKIAVVALNVKGTRVSAVYIIEQ